MSCSIMCAFVSAGSMPLSTLPPCPRSRCSQSAATPVAHQERRLQGGHHFLLSPSFRAETSLKVYHLRPRGAWQALPESAHSEELAHSRRRDRQVGARSSHGGGCRRRGLSRPRAHHARAIVPGPVWPRARVSARASRAPLRPAAAGAGMSGAWMWDSAAGNAGCARVEGSSRAPLVSCSASPWQCLPRVVAPHRRRATDGMRSRQPHATRGTRMGA